MRILKLRRVLILALTMSIMLPVMSLSAANLVQTYKKVVALTPSKSGGMTISPTKVRGPATKVPAKTTTQIPTCQVGDMGPGGGIVFYVSPTKINVRPGISLGGHCLEAAPKTWNNTASDPAIQWGCGYTSIVGTGSGIGTGASNTKKIMIGCTAPGIAARRAGNLVFGGKSDWFLPSKAELNLMRTNLYIAGLGDFGIIGYWSSSQHSKYYAWGVQFDAYGNQNVVAKGYNPLVRPIRAFG